MTLAMAPILMGEAFPSVFQVDQVLHCSTYVHLLNQLVRCSSPSSPQVARSRDSLTQQLAQVSLRKEIHYMNNESICVHLGTGKHTPSKHRHRNLALTQQWT
jgi:hypothetical protein